MLILSNAPVQRRRDSAVRCNRLFGGDNRASDHHGQFLITSSITLSTCLNANVSGTFCHTHT
jgi:hypothetical protein